MTAKVNQLVNELLSQGRWDEAYSMLANYVAQQPDDPEALFELGKFCYSAGRFQEAEKTLKLASSGPFASESFYLLGLTLLKLGRPAEAVGLSAKHVNQKRGMLLDTCIGALPSRLCLVGAAHLANLSKP